MKQAEVYLYDHSVGTITEDERGFSFQYHAAYLEQKGAEPVSLTMPLRKEAYHSQTMLSFFDGLIPEGWLLDIATENWKLSAHDRMSLLMACCGDCIGAVSVKPLYTEES
ncbi:MAG: HipA N-terminal domain-containing protein [Mediterranea sp.]|jgi:serine/threonine-protein kinase HipA|nr:HipA N-terminal domain-containing protein [Mediterranea sp.]